MSALEPSICTALLQPQDRIARAPLGGWARQLRASLALCLERSREVETLSYDVGSVANNAALVAAYQGETQVARSLCERQVWWQLRLSRRSENGAVALHGVQPWVNLARLDGMAGDWEGALARLARLDPGRTGGRVALQPLRADGVGCQALRAGGDFAILVENLFVVDSLKLLLLNQRWDEVLCFGRSLGARPRPTIMLRALEAAAVAACCKGDTEQARELALDGVRRSAEDPWRRVVFRLRAAEVAACEGHRSRAAAELAPLARGVHALSNDAKRQLQPQYVIMRLASACREVGRDADAAALARDVWDGATASGDEVFRIEAARLLAECLPGEARAEWGTVRDGLHARTLFRRFRDPEAPPADRAPLQALVADLDALFEA